MKFKYRRKTKGCQHSLPTRRIYLEEALKGAGEFTDSLEDDLADAQKILGLGPREAEDIRSEIVSKTYKCAPPGPLLLICIPLLPERIRRLLSGRTPCFCEWSV